MRKTKLVFNMDKAMRNLGYLTISVALLGEWLAIAFGAIERMCK